MTDDIDCYGYLYDENLSPCRDKCELRHRCKQKVKSKLRKLGEKEFFVQKKQVLLASEALAQSENQKSHRSYYSADQSDVSNISNQVIELCKELGLKEQFKKYYLVIKDKKQRSMLHISRLQSDQLKGLVRFVRIDERENFSDEITKFISFEKCCGQFYFTGDRLEDLKFVLTNYLKQVGAELWNP